MKTLPEWLRVKGSQVSLDVLRKRLRRLPELQRLGQQHGPVRLYTEAEVDRIIDGVERAGTLRPLMTA